MSTIKNLIQTVKRKSLSEKRAAISSLFTPFLLSKYKVEGDHTYHAAGLIHLLFNYSLSEPGRFLNKRYLEDSEIVLNENQEVSSYGFFYKSAQALSTDFFRCFGEN